MRCLMLGRVTRPNKGIPPIYRSFISVDVVPGKGSKLHPAVTGRANLRAFCALSLSSQIVALESGKLC